MISLTTGICLAGLVFGLGLDIPGLMSRIFGLAKTQFYAGRNSVTLKTHDGGRTTLVNLVRRVLPPCRLNPFLFNGHLQTIWTVLKFEAVPIYYKRHIFEQEDPVFPGSFAVDFVVKPYDATANTVAKRTTMYTEAEWKKIGSDDSRPMVIALHGLSGGSHELYLRHVLAPLVTEKGGFEACVINSRGCAGSAVTSPLLFNARSTWDMRQLVKWLRKTFPNRPLFAVGFSLGANILTNYLGEEGEDCLLTAAVALSNPWALDVSNQALQSTFLGREVYSRAMGTNLKKLFEKHKDFVQQVPGLYSDEVEKIKYLHEFDRAIQCPTWGYATEQSYYRDASCVDSVLAIRIPFLAISARDDPIVCDQAIPRQEFLVSEYGVLVTTSLGGHLSWFELGGGRWMARATTAFLTKMAQESEAVANARSSSKSKSNGEIVRTQFGKGPIRPVFDPMRRRMYVPEA